MCCWNSKFVVDRLALAIVVLFANMKLRQLDCHVDQFKMASTNLNKQYDEVLWIRQHRWRLMVRLFLTL